MKPGDLRKVCIHPFGIWLANNVSYFWDPTDPKTFTWYVYDSPVVLLSRSADDDFGTTFTFWEVLSASGVGWCRETDIICKSANT